ncbi:MAG TPA: hypothetical protein EYH58_02930 [Aquifex aeolicus]|nr:hypothetical protein [Aquifex aeolicus]
MNEILPFVESLFPYLSQAIGVILILALVFFKSLSREKEIISRIEKLSESIEEVKEELKIERERAHNLEVKLAEKYLSIDRWLELNNKFEASVKQELSRINKSLENLSRILIEVIRDGKAS